MQLATAGRNRNDQGDSCSGTQRGVRLVEMGCVLVAEHLIASTRGRDRDLLYSPRALWLWQRLRASLPEAFSCVLMPDHIHVVAPPRHVSVLRHVLTRFTTLFGVRFEIEVVPANSGKTTARMIRYGYFNPVYSSFVHDPFEWPWSTLRDLVGATYPTWTPLEELSSRLRTPPGSLLKVLTTTAELRPKPPDQDRVRKPKVVELSHLMRVAANVQRIDPASIVDRPTHRKLVVQGAYEVGTPRIHDLTDRLFVSRHAIHRYRQAPPHPALDPLLLNLSDPRLSV